MTFPVVRGSTTGDAEPTGHEELEGSKEELQSLNEELTTVNNQLQNKVGQLELATSDMANLLDSTEIATIFLDVTLRIKRFTPGATELMSLIPADVGRPIHDIAPRFTDPELLADIREVLSGHSRQ